MLQNIDILNKCFSFELYIHQTILKIKSITFPQKYEAAQLFSSLIIIRNVSWSPNQHIRMISEASCDTEDWSNDAENSALITEINYSLKYIHNENSIIAIIFHSSTVFTVFLINKCSLGEQKRLLKKTWQTWDKIWDINVWNKQKSKLMNIFNFNKPSLIFII